MDHSNYWSQAELEKEWLKKDEKKVRTCQEKDLLMQTTWDLVLDNEQKASHGANNVILCLINNVGMVEWVNVKLW